MRQLMHTPSPEEEQEDLLGRDSTESLVAPERDVQWVMELKQKKRGEGRK